VYVFPLPQNAAVNEFVMTVGDRKIRGIIREREKAEQIYAAARAQGHVAALMTQERANIFTQKVANIEPGKQIDINIRYFNTLQYDHGSYEFVFPMVVGPRFNPPATADGVGAVARNEHGSSGQSTEVQYLAPNERSGHDVSVSLNISAGVDIEDVHCVNHVMEEKRTSESQRTITLSPKDSIPNKDFVLRYKVAGNQIKTAMLTHEDQQGKYFTMMLYPPAELTQVQRSAMEMVFVLDCSGSMKGKPMEQAKNAIRHALQSLTPRDTFQIIRFSNKASRLGAEPLIATEDNIRIGLEHLASLNSTGGTQMIEGIKAALDFPHDEGRFRLVSFMTDGYIGNEQQILNAIHEKLGESRIFSFGVGSSPNRMLMDRMALLGRGAVAYLSLNDDAVEIMDRFNQRISHPAMTDLQIDWGGMDVADVYPQRLPDLIVGRPVVVTGRFKGTPDMVKVNGRVAMEPASFAVTLDEHDASKNHAGVAAVWARLKIKDLMNDATRSPAAVDEIKTSVLETALAYNLMSSFTAFVAVDSMTKTEGKFGTTVAVPVPVPHGVKYETTVGGTSVGATD
jgi:Ca-activated chloride channel family protein